VKNKVALENRKGALFFTFAEQKEEEKK